MDQETFTVLAIDDSEATLDILEVMVSENFPLTTFLRATNGMAGLRTAKAENPDIILLDVLMPCMNGFTVCEKLKQDDDLRDVPVVFVTVLVESAERVKALEAGADGFLNKPVDEAELCAQIRAMIRIREANLKRIAENRQLKEMVKLRTIELEQKLEEQRMAEQALRESEEKFSKVFYSSPYMLLITRAFDGKIYDVNESFVKQSGFTREEALKNSVSSLEIWVNAKDREKLITALQNGEKVYKWQFEFRKKNGERIIRLVTSELITIAAELCVVSYVEDITGKVLAENKLQESKAQFEAFMENLPVTAFIKTNDHKLLYVNREMRRVFDTTGWIGRHVSENLPPDIAARLIDADNGALEKGRIANTHVMPDKAGAERVWETEVFRIDRPEGEPLLGGVSMDVTERVQATEQLVASEEKFAKAFDLSPNMIGLSDLETGEYVEVNQAFYKILGFKPEEVIGKKAKDLVRMDPEIRKIALQKLNQDGSLRNFAARIYSKTGRPVDVLMWAEVIVAGDRRLNFTTAVDITELKQAKSDLETYTGLLEILMKIATRYINLPADNLDAGLNDALKEVGGFVGADRAYIFDYNHQTQTASCTHEWCEQGVASQAELFQRVPLSEFTDFLHHAKGVTFEVADKAALPEGRFKQMLGNLGIKSLISIPIMDDERCIGFVGFDAVKEKKSFSKNEKMLFEVFAQTLLNVRKRQRVQEEVFNSRERFKAIYENAPLLINAFDKEMNCVLWNKECEEVFGWTFEEMQEVKDPLKRFYPDPATYAAVKKSVTYYPVNELVEYHPVTKSGEKIVTRWLNYRLPDGLVINLGYNITEHFQTQELLKKSRQNYKQLVELAREGIFTINKDNQITYVNPYMLQMLGYPLTGIIGTEFFHFSDKKGVSKAKKIIKWLKNGLSKQLDFEFINNEGESVYTIINLTPFTDEAGNYAGALALATNITKRKLAELALRQFNDIFDNIQIGLHIYRLEDLNDDRTLRMINANPASAALTGIKVADVIGKTLDESFPLLRNLGIPQRYAEIVRKGDSRVFEDVFYADNRIAGDYFSVKAFSLPDNHLGVAFENITRQKLAQKKIEESESRLRIAEAIGNLGSWEYDIITREVKWSDNTFQIYERDPETFEVTLQSVINHYPDGEKEMVLEALEKALENGEQLKVEHRIITGKGNTRYLLEHGKILSGDDGKPLKMIGSVADITNRKLAEIETNRTIERFNMLSENSRTLYWEMNNEGKYTYLSNSCKAMLGYRPEELINKAHYADLCPPEHRDALVNWAEEVMNEKQRVENYENLMMTKSGERIWVSSNSLPVMDESGKLIGYRGSDMDISLRKQQEQLVRRHVEEVTDYQNRLNRLNALLIESVENEKKHIAHFLHDDLGQILSISRIKLTSLIEAEKPAADRQKVVRQVSDMINSAILQCRQLTYDLNPPVLKQYGLVKALKWKFDQLGQSIDMKLKLHAQNDAINLEERRAILLYRAVCELVNNAIKHSGGDKIDVSIKEIAGKLKITVSDNGAGFDYVPGVKPSGDYSFGLFSISERLTPFNGKLTIDAAPGKGTRAVIEI